MASSLWLRDDMPAKPAYVAMLQREFDAEVGSVPHDSMSSAGMNKWVRDKTQGLIRRIAPATLPSDFSASILHTIYFKGAWSSPFERYKTSVDEPFYASDGRTERGRVDIMKQISDYPYKHVERVGDVVQMPYACNGACSYAAVVVLPPVGSPPESSLAEIRRLGGIPALVALLQETVNIELFLPRFRAEFSTDLTTSLQGIGVRRSFDVAHSGAADVVLAARSHQPLAISGLFQSFVVRVDERGTEAAVSTAILLCKHKAPPIVQVNRPFLFLVLDVVSNATLFAGIMRLPE